MYANIVCALATLPKITAKFLEIDKVHPVPHTGIDFAVPEGTKLLSAGQGIVENIMDYGNTNVGKGVFIRLDNGIKLVYGHMSKINVKEGQKVNIGDVIGLSGNTGHSTGPHLHLQAYDKAGELISPMRYADGVFSAYKENWIDKITNDIEDYIGGKVDDIANKITTKLQDIASAMAIDLLDVIAVGIIGYTLIQCVKMMLLNNRSLHGEARPFDKAMLGYFIFFLLRILTTVIRLRGGQIGR